MRLNRLPVKILLLAFLVALSTVTAAADLEVLPGQAVRIVGGDTIVLEAEGTRHRVRLAGIDAPERNQPWGEAATRELRRPVAGQEVVVVWSKRDRWKRLIGIIEAGW